MQLIVWRVPYLTPVTTQDSLQTEPQPLTNLVEFFPPCLAPLTGTWAALNRSSSGRRCISSRI